MIRADLRVLIAGGFLFFVATWGLVSFFSFLRGWRRRGTASRGNFRNCPYCASVFEDFGSEDIIRCPECQSLMEVGDAARTEK